MADDENDLDLFSMYADYEIPKGPAKGYQQTAGLKLAGSHEHSIQFGDKTVRVATSDYVRSLEKQVQELRREIRDLQTYVKRMATGYNKVVDRMNAVEHGGNRRFGDME